MLNRRGVTLIELLISIVLIGIVGVATVRILRALMGTATAQVEIASAQGHARTGALALPQEFREIGYDTLAVSAGGTTSDIEAIGANRITFRAMRGVGITCGTPTLTEFRIRKPVLGVRKPLITDGFLLFVESDPNFGLDDQWVLMSVLSIDYNATCGADSAITLTLSAAPEIEPGTDIAISQHFVGGPVRWFERLEYGPVVDATTGQAFVGVRSLSLGEGTLSPVIGPLPDTTAFSLVYYNSVGTVLDPSSALPGDVRTIDLSLTTVGTRATSLAGTGTRSRAQVPMVTRIALRNTLRP